MTKSRSRLPAVFLALLASTIPASAGETDLDPTFGANGIAATSFTFNHTWVLGLQADDKLLIPAGRSGLASVGRLKAKGPTLGLPALPLAFPVLVQLRGSQGTCFEASFSASGAQRNDGTLVRAKSD